MPSGEGVFDAVISYSPQSTGTELPQLLNVVMGNTSIQTGVKVTGIDLGPLGTSRIPAHASALRACANWLARRAVHCCLRCSSRKAPARKRWPTSPIVAPSVARIW
jgi:hypothetical protein